MSQMDSFSDGLTGEGFFQGSFGLLIRAAVEAVIMQRRPLVFVSYLLADFIDIDAYIQQGRNIGLPDLMHAF